MKNAIAVYLIYVMMLIGTGMYIYNKMTDKSDPNSLGSALEQFKDTVNENSEIP